jgi:hypothetical protein
VGVILPHRRRRMQRNDQGMVCLRKSSRCRHRAGADPCGRPARSRAACGRRPGTRRSPGTPCRPEGVEFTVTRATAGVAEPSGRVEQPACGTAAGTRKRQPALAIDDAAATLERATAIFPVARHAARAAAGVASTLAAVQVAAAGTAAAGARILQSLPANAAGKTHAAAPAMASDDSRAASSRRAIPCRAAAARSALASDNAIDLLHGGGNV